MKKLYKKMYYIPIAQRLKGIKKLSTKIKNIIIIK